MPNGETHEKGNLVLLALGGSYLYYNNVIPITDLGIFAISFLFGTYLINPDLDTVSRSRRRWKWLQFIWKPFKHRGILHNPLFWIGFGCIGYYFGYGYQAAGIVASSLFHIICDWIWGGIQEIA